MQTALAHAGFDFSTTISTHDKHRLFWTLIDQFKITKHAKQAYTDQQQVRKDLCDYLKNIHHIPAHIQHEMGDLNKFEENLKTHAVGDELTLQLAAQVYSVNIRIISENGESVIQPWTEDAKEEALKNEELALIKYAEKRFESAMPKRFVITIFTQATFNEWYTYYLAHKNDPVIDIGGKSIACSSTANPNKNEHVRNGDVILFYGTKPKPKPKEDEGTSDSKKKEGVAKQEGTPDKKPRKKKQEGATPQDGGFIGYAIAVGESVKRTTLNYKIYSDDKYNAICQHVKIVTVVDWDKSVPLKDFKAQATAVIEAYNKVNQKQAENDEVPTKSKLSDNSMFSMLFLKQGFRSSWLSPSLNSTRTSFKQLCLQVILTIDAKTQPIKKRKRQEESEKEPLPKRAKVEQQPFAFENALPEDTVTMLSNKLYMSKEDVQHIYSKIVSKKQNFVIFSGFPGTCKTFAAHLFAETLAANRCQTIQFHPSYSYADFVEAIKPKLLNNTVTYGIQKGPLRTMSEKAFQDKQNLYVLIIDELNRGNIAAVFGELLFLLDYREEKSVSLTTSQEEFRLPKNLLIMSTMNPYDLSVSVVDDAVQRRASIINFDDFQNSILLRYLQERGDAELKSKATNIVKQLQLVNEQLVSYNMFIPAGVFIRSDSFAVLSASDFKILYKEFVEPKIKRAKLDHSLISLDGIL